jgi:hypothetical protein
MMPKISDQSTTRPGQHLFDRVEAEITVEDLYKLNLEVGKPRAMGKDSGIQNLGRQIRKRS